MVVARHVLRHFTGDDDEERKIHAEVLLNAYNRQLEKRRLAAGAQGLLISGDGKESDSAQHCHSDLDADDVDFDDDDDDEEFHYPGASPLESTRPPSIRSTTTDYFGRMGGSSRGPTDLTPHLSQAPEFRVPTHEAPQKVLTPRWSTPTPHQVHATWERDETVSECRSCRRRFTFLNRRVSEKSIVQLLHKLTSARIIASLPPMRAHILRSLLSLQSPLGSL